MRPRGFGLGVIAFKYLRGVKHSVAANKAQQHQRACTASEVRDLSTHTQFEINTPFARHFSQPRIPGTLISTSPQKFSQHSTEHSTEHIPQHKSQHKERIHVMSLHIFPNRIANLVFVLLIDFCNSLA